MARAFENGVHSLGLLPAFGQAEPAGFFVGAPAEGRGVPVPPGCKRPWSFAFTPLDQLRLRLTDHDFARLMQAAKPLSGSDRDAFLRDVAAGSGRPRFAASGHKRSAAALYRTEGARYRLNGIASQRRSLQRGDSWLSEVSPCTPSFFPAQHDHSGSLGSWTLFGTDVRRGNPYGRGNNPYDDRGRP